MGCAVRRNSDDRGADRHVGVVISYIGGDGKDRTGESFSHGNIVIERISWCMDADKKLSKPGDKPESN